MFSDRMLLHTIDYGLNIWCKHNFYIYEETKKFVWLTLLHHLLHWGDLEPNPHYLRGLPIWKIQA